MLRRMLCALFILGLSVTCAGADQFKGNLVRVGDGKVTIRVKSKEKGKKGEEKTFDLAKTVKVSKKEGKTTTEVTEGLKSDLVTGLSVKKKGQGGAVITNTENMVTEVIFSAAKKKKKAAK